MPTSTTKTLDRSTITSDNTSNKSVRSLRIKEIQCPSKLLYNLPLATKIITMYLDVVMSDRLQCPSLNVDSCGWSGAKHRALIRMMMIMVWLCLVLVIVFILCPPFTSRAVQGPRSALYVMSMLLLPILLHLG